MRGLYAAKSSLPYPSRAEPALAGDSRSRMRPHRPKPPRNRRQQQPNQIIPSRPARKYERQQPSHNTHHDPMQGPLRLPRRTTHRAAITTSNERTTGARYGM